MPPIMSGGEAWRALAADVAARHGEPWRRYHTSEHVGEVLGWVGRLSHRAADPQAVRLAAWLHDVVYDPAAPSGANEAASAAYARQRLPAVGVTPTVVREVSRLIGLTAAHDPAPGDADGEVLADADLAVLGASPARYARYRQDVRAEHAALDDGRWREGRARVLRAFLERPAIFRTPEARAALEARARANLAGELAALSVP